MIPELQNSKKNKKSTNTKNGNIWGAKVPGGSVLLGIGKNRNPHKKTHTEMLLLLKMVKV